MFSRRRAVSLYTQPRPCRIHYFFLQGRRGELCYFSSRYHYFHDHVFDPGRTLSKPANHPDPAQLRTWLQGAARRDRAAFRALYDASSPRLYGLALRILGRRELAEEVVQESFVAIWHHAIDYESSLSAPMTWMTAIVRNRAFDLLRRSRAEGTTDTVDRHALESIADLAATPAERLQMSSDAQALADCMAALEERHREVVGMAFFHDLSHSDVADKLMLPLGTVKTWIRRSLARLHACLGARGAA